VAFKVKGIKGKDLRVSGGAFKEEGKDLRVSGGV